MPKPKLSVPAPVPMAGPSPQARLTLQNAFERFEGTVTSNDKRLFNNTTLQDVRHEADNIERQFRARRTLRHMARLEPLLRGMEHYSKVVEVLCNGTPYLSWIWAPIKLMLMVSHLLLVMAYLIKQVAHCVSPQLLNISSRR
jgi:hypothetical protein